MTPSPLDVSPFIDKKGLVATIVIGGGVREEFSMCRENLRAWNITNGLTSVEYVNFPAVFVEVGRDEALEHARRERYDWCLQIDADATFSEAALAQILHTAYVTHPEAEIVGAYAQLKHPPYLPTIDTGTGTWEPHYPGEGVLPVIRTGAHFVLVKMSLLERIGPPWFRTRTTLRPIDALREIDNFSRVHNSGRNVLAGEAWTSLVEKAKEQAGGSETGVGEDSGLCDRARAAGATIVVNTNIVTGHIGKLVVTPDMLRDEMKKREGYLRAASGVVS